MYNFFYKSIIVFTLISFFLLLNSCQKDELAGNIYNKQITQDNLIEIVKEISKDKNLSKDNLDIITVGLTRLSTLKRDTVLGKTLKEIYNIEKEFMYEQSIATLKTQATKVELVLNHEFRFIDLVPRDTLDKFYNIIVFEIKNPSKREIKNILGTLQFFDVNGQIVKTFPIETAKLQTEHNVPSGQSKRIAIPFIHDKNNIRDEMMRNDLKSMRAVWIANMIEFADGKQISVQATNAE